MEGYVWQVFNAVWRPRWLCALLTDWHRPGLFFKASLMEFWKRSTMVPRCDMTLNPISSIPGFDPAQLQTSASEVVFLCFEPASSVGLTQKFISRRVHLSSSHSSATTDLSFFFSFEVHLSSTLSDPSQCYIALSCLRCDWCRDIEMLVSMKINVVQDALARWWQSSDQLRFTQLAVATRH